jgi:hypothetical protein
MLQHSEVRVHKSFNTILYAAFLLASQFPGCYRAGNAFLEAGFGEFVDGCRAK